MPFKFSYKHQKAYFVTGIIQDPVSVSSPGYRPWSDVLGGVTACHLLLTSDHQGERSAPGPGVTTLNKRQNQIFYKKNIFSQLNSNCTD